MSNDFLPFAVGGAANVETQSDYVADTATLQNGFTGGIAKSDKLNKVWRQSSIMAAVLAQFIVDQSGQNAVDDGTTATLEANLLAAIKNATKQTVILTDTGVANAYTAANTPALSALPSTGYVQRLNIAHANTGASTYAPDGLAAKPIYGLGLQPLQGGELPVGVVVLMYLVQAGVNSGNGAWIIIESLGGAQQIPAATQSQHAVQMGQVLGKQQIFTSSGSFTVPVGVTQIFVTAVGGGAGGGGGGGNTSSGGAGGGGGGGQGQQTVKQAITVAPAQVLTITIGAAGNGASGGTSGGTTGSTGGAGGNTTLTGSSPTVSITMTGGSPGSGGVGNSGTGITASGAGGQSGAGSTIGGGSTGGAPSVAGGTLPGSGGSGGATIFGAGGACRIGTSGGAGSSGIGYGSGGSGGTGGASSAAAGGNGGNGVAGAVLIEW